MVLAQRQLFEIITPTVSGYFLTLILIMFHPATTNSTFGPLYLCFSLLLGQYRCHSQ